MLLTHFEGAQEGCNRIKMLSSIISVFVVFIKSTSFNFSNRLSAFSFDKRSVPESFAIKIRSWPEVEIFVNTEIFSWASFRNKIGKIGPLLELPKHLWFQEKCTSLSVFTIFYNLWYLRTKCMHLLILQKLLNWFYDPFLQ